MLRSIEFEKCFMKYKALDYSCDGRLWKIKERKKKKGF